LKEEPTYKQCGQCRIYLRLYRLKPRVSRSKGASNKLWYV